MRIEKIMTSWNEKMVFARAVCSGCQKMLEGEENFCPKCGRKLSRIRLAIPSSKVIDLINDHEKKKLQEKASQQGDKVDMDILDRIDKKMFGKPSGKQKEENKETK